MVSNIAEAKQAIAQIGCPAVVKPVDGTGSVGVSLVTTEAEALEAITNLLAVTLNTRGQPVTPQVLLMSYVHGDEFSVEILDGAVIGITR